MTVLALNLTGDIYTCERQRRNNCLQKLNGRTDNSGEQLDIFLKQGWITHTVFCKRLRSIYQFKI